MSNYKNTFEQKVVCFKPIIFYFISSVNVIQTQQFIFRIQHTRMVFKFLGYLTIILSNERNIMNFRL